MHRIARTELVCGGKINTHVNIPLKSINSNPTDTRSWTTAFKLGRRGRKM